MELLDNEEKNYVLVIYTVSAKAMNYAVFQNNCLDKFHKFKKMGFYNSEYKSEWLDDKYVRMSDDHNNNHTMDLHKTNEGNLKIYNIDSLDIEYRIKYEFIRLYYEHKFYKNKSIKYKKNNENEPKR